MQMSRQNALLVAAMAALLVSESACSRNRAYASPGPEAPTIIEVENQAYSDVVMYVANGGTRFRLGLVPSQSKENFSLPRQLRQANGAVQFVARPIAGRAYALPAVLVSAGQLIAVTLLSQPALSTVAVWDR